MRSRLHEGNLAMWREPEQSEAVSSDRMILCPGMVDIKLEIKPRRLAGIYRTRQLLGLLFSWVKKSLEIPFH